MCNTCADWSVAEGITYDSNGDLPTSGVTYAFYPGTVCAPEYKVSQAPKIYVVKEFPEQFTKAHNTDAGFDIRANENSVIMPGTKEVISTGLRVHIPEGYVGLVKSRSGLSVRHELEHGAGVVDSGYTGEVKVVLRNFGHEWYKVSKKDKIAQMVIVPICTLEVEEVETLDDTERGTSGFNSSGYK
jgi:dUTP pyrophosphatase